MCTIYNLVYGTHSYSVIPHIQYILSQVALMPATVELWTFSLHLFCTEMYMGCYFYVNDFFPLWPMPGTDFCWKDIRSTVTLQRQTRIRPLIVKEKVVLILRCSQLYFGITDQNRRLRRLVVFTQEALGYTRDKRQQNLLQRVYRHIAITTFMCVKTSLQNKC